MYYVLYFVSQHSLHPSHSVVSQERPHIQNLHYNYSYRVCQGLWPTYLTMSCWFWLKPILANDLVASKKYQCGQNRSKKCLCLKVHSLWQIIFNWDPFFTIPDSITKQIKMTEPLRVVVTGAAGQIGYSLVYMIACGSVFGDEQPLILQVSISPTFYMCKKLSHFMI